MAWSWFCLRRSGDSNEAAVFLPVSVRGAAISRLPCFLCVAAAIGADYGSLLLLEISGEVWSLVGWTLEREKKQNILDTMWQAAKGPCTWTVRTTVGLVMEMG